MRKKIFLIRRALLRRERWDSLMPAKLTLGKVYSCGPPYSKSLYSGLPSSPLPDHTRGFSISILAAFFVFFDFDDILYSGDLRPNQASNGHISCLGWTPSPAFLLRSSSSSG